MRNEASVDGGGVLASRGSRLRLLGLAGVLLAFGCNQSDFGDGVPPAVGDEGGDGGGDGDGPGSGARTDDEDVSCESEDDCGMGETCAEGVCQMARCNDGPYIGAPPLGGGLKFFNDQEFIVADTMPSDGEFYIDGYAPTPGAVDYPGSWSMGDQPILDLAGGDFYGNNEEMFVVGVDGSNELVLGGTDESIRMGIGFQPTSIAAGDIDHDGKDEVVALGQFGNVAVCNMKEHDCNTFLFENANGKDLAIADVDGDGYAEVVFLLDNGGNEVLYVWQAEPQGELDEDYQGPTGVPLMRIDAGDIDGDGSPEVLGLRDDGFFDSARLYVFSVADGGVAEVSSQDVDDASRDISLADIDMDQEDEVLILRDGGTIELLTSNGAGGIQPVMTHQLQVSVDPKRISASDFDGDSPRTRLMNPEGTLLPGPVTPVIVGHFAPYSIEHSDGESVTFIGDAESMSESITDFVSVKASLELGVSGNLLGIFGGGLSTRVSQEVSKSFTESTEYFVGRRVIAKPSPEHVGYDYGVVFLSCACYHAYYYEMIDPAERLGPGGDQEQFVMILPVGGTTTAWSSKRYNAMAEAVGDLPIVEIPYIVGDLDSYPTGPQLSNGDPVPAEDMVFPEVPNLLVSDVGSIGWWLSVTERETNEVAMSTSIDISGSLNVGPFKFGAGVGGGFGKAHSISVGEQALFGGTAPPIPDDPETPEDEYLNNAYSFSPYVYREHYEDRDGNDAAYYVMSFAVAKDD